MGGNPTEKPLCVDLKKKTITREDNEHTSLTEAYIMMIHWVSTDRGAGRFHTFNPDSHMSFLNHEDDEERVK